MLIAQIGIGARNIDARCPNFHQVFDAYYILSVVSGYLFLLSI